MFKKYLHTFKPWHLILFSVFAWRILLFGISIFADTFLLYQPTFPYFDSILLETKLPRWLYSWANFDGVHYITIVSKGYVGTGLIQAFFPLYPLLSSTFNILFRNPFLSLFTINHLALFALAVMWWQWVSQVWDKKIATFSLVLLLMSPTAFFLGATYTESLFILLIVLTFWFIHKKNWWLAAVMVGLASATRIVGIALLPALLLEWWIKTKPDVRSLQTYKVALPILLLSVSGLAGFMYYLGTTFGDPLYFYHVQSEFGAGRQEGIILLPQVFWRAIKIVLTYQTQDWRLWSYAQELILSVLALGGLFLSFFWKKKSWGLLAFSGLAYLLPTLTGTLSSMPRYILVCLPLWLWLASVLSTRRWLFILFLVGSTVALCVNTLLFIQGYWVA